MLKCRPDLNRDVSAFAVLGSRLNAKPRSLTNEYPILSPQSLLQALRAAHSSLFTIHHSPFTIHHSPFTIHYSRFSRCFHNVSITNKKHNHHKPLLMETFCRWKHSWKHSWKDFCALWKHFQKFMEILFEFMETLMMSDGNAFTLHPSPLLKKTEWSKEPSIQRPILNRFKQVSRVYCLSVTIIHPLFSPASPSEGYCTTEMNWGPSGDEFIIRASFNSSQDGWSPSDIPLPKEILTEEEQVRGRALATQVSLHHRPRSAHVTRAGVVCACAWMCLLAKG